MPSAWITWLPVLVCIACAPPDAKGSLPGADLERGRDVMVSAGCGSCHVIPGIEWPAGTVGPALSRVSAQSLIAGQLPNRPDILAAFVRDAPSLITGTAMPAMPISERDAYDVAAYLYAHSSH